VVLGISCIGIVASPKGFGEKNCLGALAADIVRGGQEQAGLESAADLEAVVIGVAYRLGLGAGGEISRATVAVTLTIARWNSRT